MNRDATAAALEQLLNTPGRRSKMGRFREVADLVERAATAGVKREAILETLKAQGLELSPATLNSYLTRHRKAAAATQAAAPSSTPPAVPAQPVSHKAGPLQAPTPSAPPRMSPSPAEVAVPAAPATAPPSGRSIREIRRDPVDFAGAKAWVREQQRLRKEEAKNPPPPSTV